MTESKKICLLILISSLACVVVAPVVAQETYTNKDLGKLHIPGAYTNDDLKALPPLAVQKAPIVQVQPVDLSKLISELTEAAARREEKRRVLVHAQDRLQAELDYQLELTRVVYISPTQGRIGRRPRELDSYYRGGLSGGGEFRGLHYLRREIALLEWDISQLSRY